MLMAEATAKSIYYARYWTPLSLDKINDAGVAICMFDIGVVRGIGVPPRYAQAIANVTVDGHIGEITLAAINAMKPADFITQFSAAVASGFRAIVAANPSQKVFLKGWLNRAKRLLTLIK
jgi:lysozyme family protein